MKKVLMTLVSLFLLTGTVVWAQDQDRDRVKKQDRIHQEDHLMLQDGKLYQFKQGVQTQVQAQLRLNNGTVINPDGTYQLQNQQRYQLRDGECLDMNGNRYLNQNKFNNRKMMTNKQIERCRTKAMDKNRMGSQGSGGGNRSGRN
jgi:TolA-binding protein